MSELDDIVKEFLLESYENLDRLDRDLVQLEKEPSSNDLISSIFRTIHTIKGTCGFLGFGKLESVSHVGENLLSRLRDGLLILDMPPEEAAANVGMHWSGGLDPIRLVAPTTPPGRMKGICETARGFIYYVSREGVTGEQTSLSTSIASQVEMLRTFTKLPIAVGFGISTPEQSAEVGRHADAVVVGSAIVRHIAESKDQTGLGKRVEEFVAPLASAAHGARLSVG